MLPLSTLRVSSLLPGGTRLHRCVLNTLWCLIPLLVGTALPLHAQYFGQNRVRWEPFDVQVLRTEHFDIHFDRRAEPAVRETARKAERWYSRMSTLFGHTFVGRKPLILYTNHPDFQQTTLSDAPLSEGTRGFAESLRDRLVMPLTGVGAENDHVLGHEIAHLFQFDMARRAGAAEGMMRLPLWFVEGMAEYVSVGSDDPNTAMWLRAALAADALPTIDALSTDPRLFPYRYGHAFWAYVGGRFGDDFVGALFRNALAIGVRGAIERTLGVPVALLEDDWHGSIRAAYAPMVTQREAVSALGTVLRPTAARGGIALNPQLSPDGAWLTYIGRDELGRVDVRLRDMTSGRDVRSLGALARDAHTDALAFLYASGAWSPDSRQYAQVVVRRGDSELALIDVRRGTLSQRVRVPGVQSISAVSWSPDGRQLAIAGTSNGQGDLFLYDLQERRVQQLTNDPYTELHPAWSPNGRYIAVATDRHEETDLTSLSYGRLRLALVDPVGGRVRTVPDLGARARMINPQWSGDSRALYFVGDVDGVADVFRLDLSRGVFDQLTNVRTGISGVTTRSPALTFSSATNTMVVTVFDNDGYHLVAVDRTRVENHQRLAMHEMPVTEPLLQGMGGVLPPVTASPAPFIDEMLADGATGLPGPTAGAPFVSRYTPRFALEGVGMPAAGIAAGPNGAAVGGGISVFWGDLLARRRLGMALMAQGRVQDVGGQLLYVNAVSRWNVFFTLGRTPLPSVTGGAGSVRVRDGGGETIDATLLENGIMRTMLHQATFGAQYPFSRTTRMEVATTGTRLSQDFDVTRQLVSNATGQLLDRRRLRGSLGDPLHYAEWSTALVGDDAVFGAASPFAGWRYRVELSQTTGNTTFTAVTIDGRRYQPVWRGALAVRAMHTGRFGRDATLGMLAPMFVGAGTLVRGYTAESLADMECRRSTAITGCAAFEQLLGSRMAVANVEYRLPLDRVGVRGLGLEIAPFVDAGLAWRAGDALSLTPRPLSRAGESGRHPVLSHGLSARLNAGALIVEFFHARPLQRGGRMFGVNLAPGW
jgi:hypothetical protein